MPEWDSRVHVVDFVGALKLWLFFLGVDLLLLNEQEEAIAKKSHTAADEKRESLKSPISRPSEHRKCLPRRREIPSLACSYLQVV